MIKSLQLKLMLIVLAFVVLSAVVWILRVKTIESSAVEARLNEQLYSLVVKKEAYFQSEIENRKALLQTTWGLLYKPTFDQHHTISAAKQLANILQRSFSRIVFSPVGALDKSKNKQVYLSDDKRWVKSVSLPISAGDGVVVGEVIADIDILNLLSDFGWLSIHNEAVHGFIMLGDENIIKLYPGVFKSKKVLDKLNLFFKENNKSLYNHPFNTVVVIEHLKQNVHLITHKIPDTNALVGFFYTDDAIKKNVNMVLPEFYVSISLLGLFVFLVSFLGLRYSVIHRLTVLSKATEKIDRDSGLMSVPYLGEDEIGRLGKSINIMLAHIHNLMLGLDKKIIEINDKNIETEKLAYYDSLTGLANRVLFKAKLDEMLLNAKNKETKFALLYLDLDGFKRINDNYGHESGDELLVEVAKRLVNTLRSDDTIARIGGDEFSILLNEIDSPHYALVVANKIISELNHPIKIQGKENVIGVSIGITIAPDDGLDATLLMKNADLSMYSAKAKGRNTFGFYTTNMNLEVKHRLTLERDLREALREGQFELYYQPLVDLKLGHVVAAEALLRWNHPTKGLIMPDAFIPIAEETGLIVAIGKWVLSTACNQVNSIHRALKHDFKLSVNISARQLNDDAFLETLAKILTTSRLSPESLELEITETAMMDGASNSFELLDKIRAMGCSLAIDDFGTGYSSLSYLKRLPINSLKIDKSFVESLPDDVEDVAITSLIATMANNLNYKIIAEGIETEAQFEFLKKCGCHYGQGFFFSKPLSADKYMQLLFDEYNANK